MSFTMWDVGECCCGGVPTCAAPGFGCCCGSTLAVPLTLFGSACGTMWTLTAQLDVTGCIIAWSGLASVPSTNVAALGMCTPTSCTWDCATTITDFTTISMELVCNGSGLPSFGSVGSILECGPGAPIAWMPTSCASTVCGNQNTNLCYDSGCGIDMVATTGTWGAVVALSAVFGTFYGIPGNCFAAVGGCSGASVLITS